MKVAFWVHHLSTAHQLMKEPISEIIKESDWLTEEITYLLPKTNKQTEKLPTNHMPSHNIKMILKERIAKFIKCKDHFPLKQKGCKKESYGSEDQILKNKMTKKKKKKNFSIVWIVYKKDFDSVPHEWILKVLNISKISPVIIFLKHIMERWHANLRIIYEKGMLKINNPNVNNRIFQGDSFVFV